MTEVQSDLEKNGDPSSPCVSKNENEILTTEAILGDNLIDKSTGVDIDVSKPYEINGKVVIPIAEKVATAQAQRDALPPGLTGKQRRCANLVPVKKGERLARSGRPLLTERFPDLMKFFLDAKTVDITITYPNRPTRNIKMDSTSSFRAAIVAGMVRSAVGGDLNAAKELLDRTEGKAVQPVADVTNRPFVVVTGEGIEEVNDEAIDIINEGASLT